MKKITTWYGKPIEDLTREELIEVIEFLGDELSQYRTPEAIHAYSLGKAEVLKGR